MASRSGTLTYEIVARLTRAGIGHGDLRRGGRRRHGRHDFPEIARLFQDDPQTEAIVFVGEIGGSMEEEVAALVRERTISKPGVAYLAGRNAPEGKRMGHAGAIVAGGRGSVRSKLRAFEEATGCTVASRRQSVWPSFPQALLPAFVIWLVTSGCHDESSRKV